MVGHGAHRQAGPGALPRSPLILHRPLDTSGHLTNEMFSVHVIGSTFVAAVNVRISNYYQKQEAIVRIVQHTRSTFDRFDYFK